DVAKREAGADADRGVRRAWRGGVAQPQGAPVHLIPPPDHPRLLDAVLELTDVAGPLIAREELHGRRRDRADALAMGRAELPEKVVHEEGDVALALPGRRGLD